MESFLDTLMASPCEVLRNREPPLDLLDELRPDPPSDEPYAKRLLREDEQGEILLMTWNPGVRCAPHGHDAARGTVAILEGTFEERRFEFEGDGLRRVRRQRAGAPETVDIPRGAIHDMLLCEGEGPGCTLHVYRPRIDRMRIYDRDEQRTLVVGPGAGAWLPPAHSDIVRIDEWGAK